MAKSCECELSGPLSFSLSAFCVWAQLHGVCSWLCVAGHLPRAIWRNPLSDHLCAFLFQLVFFKFRRCLLGLIALPDWFKIGLTGPINPPYSITKIIVWCLSLSSLSKTIQWICSKIVWFGFLNLCLDFKRCTWSWFNPIPAWRG